MIFYGELPYLPEDIVVGIFTRLPVKSLIRFKCISKLFSSLISDREFIDTHLSMSSKNHDLTRVIVNSSKTQLDFKSYSLYSIINSHLSNAQDLDCPLIDTSDYVMTGSINGLVCIAIARRELFIWNPSTRVSKKLPIVDIEKRCLCSAINGVGFGFGFDERIDDYKVVRVFYVVCDDDSTRYMVRVYSLRSDSWKIIADFPSLTSLAESAQYLNGSLHWLGLQNIFSDYSNVIVSLDLTYETYSHIERPNYDIDQCTELSLGVLQGCLCVMVGIYGDRYDFWVFKKYELRCNWMKLCVIPCFVDQMYLRYSLPLSISSSGELLLGNGERFVLYNPTHGTFKQTEVPMLHMRFHELVTYVESLVSPILL